MNLPEDLKRQLVQAVLGMIGEPVTTPMVQQLIGLEEMSKARPGMNGPMYADWMVAHSLRQPKPDLFIRVVTKADPAGALPDLQALAAGLKANEVAWTGVEIGLWIPAGWPFLDRENLRTTLEEMAAGGGPPALSIEGATGDGKKTMAAYIEDLAGHTDSFRPIVRELRPQPGANPLFAIALDLFAELMPPQGSLATTHEEPERQARAYASDIATVAPTAPAPVWFVANVIGLTTNDDGQLPFVDELLKLVKSTPEYAEKLRVLVLCDRLATLGLENAPPPSARHTLPQISDVEIRKWLEAVAPGKSEALYKVTAERVLRSLEDETIKPVDRLRMLAFQCKRAHAML